MAIETAFIGTVARDTTPKVSASGKKYMRVNLRVGTGDNTQWVMVTVFGEMVDEIAGHAVKGMPLYIEGRLTLDSWKSGDGRERTGLSVAAWKCAPPKNGKRKECKATSKPAAPSATNIVPPQGAALSDELNDDIGF